MYNGPYQGGLVLSAPDFYLKMHNFFNRLIKRDSPLRPFAKPIGTDLRTLSRAFRPWKRLEAKPQCLFIEPTNICNSNCIFCAYQFQDRLRRGRGFMSPELYKKALDGYERLGGHKWLYICSLVGEPLLDPGIIEKIYRAKQRGFFVTIFTNGIMLNKVDAARLLKSGIDEIVVSTAPFDEKSYISLCRNKSYKDVLEGTARLLKERNLSDSRCIISIAFRSHISFKKIIDLPDYKNLILPLLRDNEKRSVYECSRIKDFDNWGGQIRKKDLIGIMDLARPPLFKFRPCIRTFSVVVWYDGKVRGCDCRFADTERDELYLGDLNKDPLEGIWRGKPMKDLRRKFSQGRLPKVCRSCTMYLAC